MDGPRQPNRITRAVHAKTRSRRVVPEKTALFLLGFMALNAIPAGLLLVLRPDGSLIGLPPSLLEETPFPDFRIPGLALAALVGGSSLAACLLVLRRHSRARAATLLAGLIQVGWIAGQVAFIGYQGFLQPLVLGLGLATVLVGIPRRPS